LRVLHVTSTYPRAPGDATGPFLADLVAASRQAGLDVRVVAPHAPDVVAMEGVRRFRYGPARAEVLAYRGGLLSAARGRGALLVPPYMAAMSWAVASEARRWRPDIVHAHWWLPGGVAALAGARVGGRKGGPVPVIVTLHGSDVPVARRLRPLARRVAGRAAVVTAVSGALAAEASEILDLPVAVTAMPVVVTPRSPPSSPPARAGIVAVGRLMPEKGFDVLIDALRLAPMPLTIVGSGPLEAALREQAAGMDVRWTGTLARAALHDLLAGAAAVVVPSRREGLGLVAVEAILLGTPVIASFTGGLPEALGAYDAPRPSYGEVLDAPGGLLVPPDHVGALAAALARVPTLGSPGALAVAGAARHRPDAVAERHVALYRSVLDSTGGR